MGKTSYLCKKIEKQDRNEESIKDLTAEHFGIGSDCR